MSVRYSVLVDDDIYEDEVLNSICSKVLNTNSECIPANFYFAITAGHKNVRKYFRKAIDLAYARNYNCKESRIMCECYLDFLHDECNDIRNVKPTDEAEFLKYYNLMLLFQPNKESLITFQAFLRSNQYTFWSLYEKIYKVVDSLLRIEESMYIYSNWNNLLPGIQNYVTAFSCFGFC